jgi:hypothetical protein
MQLCSDSSIAKLSSSVVTHDNCACCVCIFVDPKTVFKWPSCLKKVHRRECCWVEIQHCMFYIFLNFFRLFSKGIQSLSLLYTKPF